MTTHRFIRPLHLNFANPKVDYTGREIVLFGRSDYCAIVAESLKNLRALPRCFCRTVGNSDTFRSGRLYGLPQLTAYEARSTYPASMAVLAAPPAEFEHARASALAAGWNTTSDCAAILAISPPAAMATSFSKNWLYYLLDQFFIQYFFLADPSFLLIPSIDLMVTERCSLRCRDCSNLMQYYEYPKDFTVEPTSSALAAIISAVDYLFDLRVLGGEPFINKNLVEFLACAVSHEKIGRITVFTNGTIVPTAKQLSVLASSSTFVRISDYGQLSRNLSKVTAALDFHGVNYEVRTPGWQDCASIKETLGDQKKKFGECCTNDTLTLLGHNLYQCPFAANGYNLDALPPSEDAAFSILDNNLEQIREQIRTMLRGIKSTAACSYCSGRPASAESYGHPVAIQAKSPLPYRKMNI